MRFNIFSHKTSVKKLIQKHKALVFYLLSGIVFRIFNYKEYLYFIWDQGRDAFAIHNIAQGHLKLVGPTTGLQGFFLGPLWFYLGVPGYWLFNGSPYGIALWYILLGCLALPIFWKLSHKIFKEKWWALLCAYLLAFIPGSIHAATFVWNPLISVPLLALGIYLLLQGRESLARALGGMFCIALTLQSEFAYGIFILVPLVFLFPWIRGKLRWIEIFLMVCIVSVTFLPQAAFEIRNNFIMLKSLLGSFGKDSISWSILFTRRPLELWDTTAHFFFTNREARALFIIPFTIIVFGLYRSFRSIEFQLKFLALISIIPYIFYMIWRGNHGFFFDYYITPHFIPLTLVMVFGLRELVMFFRETQYRKYTHPLLFAYIGVLFAFSFAHLYNTVLVPDNNAGLKVMEQAVSQMFRWSKSDKESQAMFGIYVPNVMTEHYDYLVRWYAKTQAKVEIPTTVRKDNDLAWYLLIEPDREMPERSFIPWYKRATDKGILVRRELVGDLIIETWMTPEFAVERGFREEHTVQR